MKTKAKSLAEFLYEQYNRTRKECPFQKLSKPGRVRWHHIASAFVCELERRQKPLDETAKSR